MEKITLHCVPAQAGEQAKVVIQGHTLHDIILVHMTKVKEGAREVQRFTIDTGPIPLTMTDVAYVRQQVILDVLPEFKRRVGTFRNYIDLDKQHTRKNKK